MLNTRKDGFFFSYVNDHHLSETNCFENGDIKYTHFGKSDKTNCSCFFFIKFLNLRVLFSLCGRLCRKVIDKCFVMEMADAWIFSNDI